MQKFLLWVLASTLMLCGLLPLATRAETAVPEAPTVLGFKVAAMVPVQPVAELCGATVNVDKSRITVKRDARTIVFTLDNTAAESNGKNITLLLAPFARDGVTFVPIQALVEALGGKLPEPAAGDPPTLTMTFDDRPAITLPLQEQPGTPADTNRGTTDLFLITLDGARLHQLTYDITTPTMMDRRNARFTQDGTSIVYGRGTDVFRRQLTQPNGTTLTAAFSKTGVENGFALPNPDGSVAFVQFNMKAEDLAKELPDLCRMDADGNGFKKLAKGLLPQRSADGSLIAYVGLDKDGFPSVHVMKADGTDDRQLADGVLSALAPDGAHLTYMKMKKSDQGPVPDGFSALTVADGKPVPPGPAEAGAPAVISGPFSTYSPDSTRLICANADDGLWVMNADLTKKTRLTSDKNDRLPLFSPDGKKVAFVRGNDLYLMNADGSDAKAIASGYVVVDYTFSPDGTQILAEGIPVSALPKPPAQQPLIPAVKRDPQTAPTDAEVTAARQAGTRKATIKTSKGAIVLELYGKDAPLTTANFVKLAKAKFYDGLYFHRVVPGFVIQGGDPAGNGSGGPGYTIKREIAPKLKHVEGALAMARTPEPDSAGSQFYITLAVTPQLDNEYAVFGKVVEGMDVVKKIEVGDKIVSVTVK